MLLQWLCNLYREYGINWTKSYKTREREQWELERQFIQGEGGLNVGVLGYAKSLEDLQKASLGASGGANWLDGY
jgi:hypothetical protein